MSTKNVIQPTLASLTIPLCLLCALLELPAIAQTADDRERTGDLRVMSFNIRYGTAPDGKNHWKNRQDNVVTTIKDFRPDLVGTQEVLDFQAQHLKEKMPGYHYIGRSRDKNRRGEQCGILVHRDRFDILETGHFWLSQTPNIPASRSWDSALPRMVSWVKLFDRSDRKVIYFANTHFDHRGKQARLESARTLVEWIKKFEPGIPIVVVGDFNSGPKSAPYAVLTQTLKDTFTQRQDGFANQGTFNGFRGNNSGVRIDMIFVSPSFRVLAAEIDRRKFNGKNPSDHYPVTSVLRWK